MDTDDEMKSAVREKYAYIANHAGSVACEKSCGCRTDDVSMLGDSYGSMDGYNPEADLHLGCGTPTDGAGIRAGDVVLDLGSGAGNDVFVARRIVGNAGHVLGVDMTEAMIARASENNRKFGFDNVEFRLGEIESLPVESGTIDVVISNCVLNLVPNKLKAFSEIYRVLKPGGRFSISDIVTTRPLQDKLRKVADLYTSCVSGASVREDYLRIISEVGFVNIEVRREIGTPVPEGIHAELTCDEAAAFNGSGTEILSITVQGEKPKN